MQDVCSNKQSITDMLQMLGVFEKSVSPCERAVPKVDPLLGLYLLISWLQRRKEELIDESRSGEQEEYCDTSRKKKR